MQLLELHLPRYRGLQDFTLDLSEGGDIYVLVGRNGRGKSRVLQAVAEIFGSLWRGQRAPFGYRIKYSRGGHVVEVSQPAIRSTPKMTVTNGDSVSIVVHKADWSVHLPDHLFGYQAARESGWGEEFDRHKRDDMAAARGADPAAAGQSLARGVRPLFLCDVTHLPLILLALLSNWSEKFAHLAERDVHISGFASADITIRRPSWFKRSRDTDKPYWGLEGDAPALFDAIATQGRFGAIPDASASSTYTDFRITIATPDDLKSFRRLFASDVAMFAMFERLHSAGLLTASVRLNMVDGHQIRPEELSAGEQQILTIMGMLRLQRGEESLFLLDEPASHFHPGWSKRWHSTVQDMLEDGQNSQFIAATHDPALVLNIPRGQIRMLHGSSVGAVRAEMPTVDPRGHGVGALLTTELYGLSTQLDDHTQSLIDMQYELSRMPALNEEDNRRLRSVNQELESLGFDTIRRDKVVSLFLAELDRRRKELLRSAGSADPPSSEELAAMVRRLFDERLTRGL
ncbi:AAA family ATPase [Streptomyces albogriseolus]|uniref:AAA family ATPase n=1 Tax=Streptomyces TaxID=1883 RepID=UPI00255285B5|nr:AAA family ATPase [Streptomyces sp. NBRC 14336]